MTSAVRILRGLIIIMESKFANKVYVGKDFTKFDVINALRTALTLMGEKYD